MSQIAGDVDRGHGRHRHRRQPARAPGQRGRDPWGSPPFRRTIPKTKGDPRNQGLRRRPIRARMPRPRAGATMSEDVLAVILGGGRGSRLFPLTLHRSQAGRAHRRQVPADRHPGQQLPELRTCGASSCSPSTTRRASTSTSTQTYKFDIFSSGFVSRAGRGADRGEPRLVPGHRRRRAPEPAPPRDAPVPRRPDPLRRPALPDGLPEDAARRTGATWPTPPWP